MHTHYEKTMGAIEAHYPGMKAAFHPFAAFGFNIGRKIVTAPHKDHQNFVTGLCLVIPFDHFDHKASCRLILKEFGIEMEVGAGVPVLIPSALVTHYNTAMQDAGIRMSFTAWSAGSLFQWVDLGNQPLCALSQSEQAEEHARIPQKILEGLERFPLA